MTHASATVFTVWKQHPRHTSAWVPRSWIFPRSRICARYRTARPTMIRTIIRSGRWREETRSLMICAKRGISPRKPAMRQKQRNLRCVRKSRRSDFIITRRPMRLTVRRNIWWSWTDLISVMNLTVRKIMRIMSSCMRSSMSLRRQICTPAATKSIRHWILQSRRRYRRFWMMNCRLTGKWIRIPKFTRFRGQWRWSIMTPVKW